MKAIQLDKPRSFRRIEIAEPTAPGPGDALARIHRIGICGTDYGGYLGKMPFFSYPRNPRPGANVLVIGAGPIGLSVVEFARLSGAKTLVMDMNDQRLSFVQERMGVSDTILTRSDGEELKRLGELTKGQLADVVVDATGSNQSMSHALNYCAFAGRLVFVGITQEPVSFPHAPIMHRREFTLG